MEARGLEALKGKEEKLRCLLLNGMRGDGVAYRHFLSALADHLRGFLRRRIGTSDTDVEDLIQDVLLAVHNARSSYCAERPVTAWVQAIARYKLIDHFRGRSRHEWYNDSLDDVEHLLEASDSQQAEVKRDLEKLMATLPDKQRLPIIHVKLQGFSVAETARITGQSESAVKVGVHRGLKALAAKVRNAR